jgi:hypothetical protein
LEAAGDHVWRQRAQGVAARRKREFLGLGAQLTPDQRAFFEALPPEYAD